MIWMIALKNIWRNKVRSLVILLAIASGIFCGVFSGGVMMGIGNQRIEDAIDKEISHLQLHNPAFIENYELKYMMKLSNPLMNHLSACPGIQAWTDHIRFTALAATAGNSAGVMVFGLDPSKEIKVSMLYKSIADSMGSYLDASEPNQIVVGQKLAKKLKLKLHSKLVVTCQDLNGDIAGAAFRVRGIYQTNNTLFDEVNVFALKSDISALVMMDTDACHEISVRLKQGADIHSAKSALQSLMPEALVQTWYEVDPLLGMLNQYMDLMLYIFLGIILLALGFGIVNTMLMVVLERTKELGVLTSIGMTKGRVFRMIMLESVYLSLIGGIMGMVAGWAAVSYYGHHGVDLSMVAEGLKGVGYSPVIYTCLPLKYYFGIGGMIMLTGVLASIYPGRKALKLNPAEAVRAE